MAAISNKVFIVFREEAAFSIVILFFASLVAYTKYGKTSIATMASKEAIVTAELINALKYLPLLS